MLSHGFRGAVAAAVRVCCERRARGHAEMRSHCSLARGVKSL